MKNPQVVYRAKVSHSDSNKDQKRHKKLLLCSVRVIKQQSSFHKPCQQGGVRQQKKRFVSHFSQTPFNFLTSLAPSSQCGINQVHDAAKIFHLKQLFNPLTSLFFCRKGIKNSGKMLDQYALLLLKLPLNICLEKSAWQKKVFIGLIFFAYCFQKSFVSCR